MKPYGRAYDKKGAIMLATYYFPADRLVEQKLTSLDEFRARRFVPPRPSRSRFLKRFGANGLTVGAPEVPSALERGVVDGVLTANAGGGKSGKTC